MNLNPDIWGPHYWFVLYTIAISYPINPNDVTKKNIMILYKIYHYLFQFLILEIILVNL